MNYFYKITRQEADLIGRFFYDEHNEFNPYVGEQNDSSFLIAEVMYILLKNTEQFKRVDFSGKQKISSANLDTKISNI